MVTIPAAQELSRDNQETGGGVEEVPNQPRVSDRYNDTTSDLTLVSSDGVKFKLESGWLKMIS